MTAAKPLRSEVWQLATGQVVVRDGADSWWVFEPDGRDHGVSEVPEDAVRLVPEPDFDLRAACLRELFRRCDEIERGNREATTNDLVDRRDVITTGEVRALLAATTTETPEEARGA